MENKKNIINKIILIVLGVLNIALIASDLYLTFENGFHVTNLIKALVLLSIMYYATFAYKKPHGNELKYIILIALFLELLQLSFMKLDPGAEGIVITDVIRDACIFLAVILMAFVSGRLDRIKENKIIFLVVIALIVANIIIQKVSFVPLEPEGGAMIAEGMSKFKYLLMGLSSYNFLIEIILIMAAYLCRYQLHKEAGLK